MADAYDIPPYVIPILQGAAGAARPEAVRQVVVRARARARARGRLGVEKRWWWWSRRRALVLAVAVGRVEAVVVVGGSGQWSLAGGRCPGGPGGPGDPVARPRTLRQLRALNGSALGNAVPRGRSAPSTASAFTPSWSACRTC